MTERSAADAMALQLAAMAAATCVGAFLLALPLRRLAPRTGLVAVPNARSSHRVPVPTGGGIAFVVPVTACWCVIALLHGNPALLLTAVLGLALAVLGCVDDRRRLPPGLRLWMQLAASGTLAATVLWRMPGWESPAHVALVAGAALAVAWSTNLFNFMDGLDGLATAESLFVALGGLALAVGTGADLGFALALAALAGGLLGFLPWNAPKARMFMGDAGSTWLGFSLAALAIQDSARMPALLGAWLILPALFVADATVCVARRAMRREDVTAAHRAHAYQNLSRRLGSHVKVVLLFVAGNLCLVPAAWASIAWPQWRWTIVMAAYAVAIGAAVAARSGVHGVADPETRGERSADEGTRPR